VYIAGLMNEIQRDTRRIAPASASVGSIDIYLKRDSQINAEMKTVISADRQNVSAGVILNHGTLKEIRNPRMLKAVPMNWRISYFAREPKSD
jgi:hypothetical protein